MNKKYDLVFLNEGTFQPITTGGDFYKVNFFKYLSLKLNIKIITVSRDYEKEIHLYKKLLQNINNRYEIEVIPPYIFYSDLDYLVESIGTTRCIMFNDAINMNTLGKKLRFQLKCKICYEAHNINYILNESLGLYDSKTKNLREREIEYNALHIGDFIFVRSELDKKNLVNLNEKFADKVYVGRSGIDDISIKNIYHLSNTRKLSKNIIFFGHLNYQPNITAVMNIIDFIAPELYKYDKEIVINIGGVGLNHLKNKYFPNVHFVGHVENVDEFMKNADLALCPLIEGSGTRIKILDYLARGIPTISTDKGIEGLDKEIRKSIILENDIKNFSSIIKSIYSETNTNNLINLSQKSIDFVLKHRAWSNIIDDYYIPISKLCLY